MKLMTFTAPTPAQALKAAQKECGEDALVVSTKQIRKKSLTQPALYEIVVAVEDVPPSSKKESVSIQPSTSKYQTLQNVSSMEEDPEEVFVNISKVARQISEIAQVSQPERTVPLKKSAQVVYRCPMFRINLKS